MNKVISKHRSVAVQEMIKEFDNLFNQGKSIEDIAKIHGVNPSYAYKILKEIAQHYGKNRNDYIRRSSFKKENVVFGQNHTSYTHYKAKDIELIKEGYENTILQIDNLQKLVQNVLEKTQNSSMFEKEEDSI